LQLAWLDAQQKDRAFAAASRFTVAAIHAPVAIDFAIRAGITVDPALKEATRWHHALSSRPTASA